MSKQTQRFDAQKTNILAQLRTEQGVTQQAVAEFFTLKDRGSIQAWEAGYSSPPPKHRARFFVYLLDLLGLRKDPGRLRHLWDNIMVDVWMWEPLSLDELAVYFPQALPGTTAPAPLFLAPPRSLQRLVGRAVLLNTVKRRLADLETVTLYGLPGVGKTALAVELAHDRELLQHFRDGVLWARLGRNADVMSELSKWGLALGMTLPEVGAYPTVERRAEAVHGRMGMRRLLLVVDDVWEIAAGQAFQLGGPNCVRLFTTRFPTIATDLAEDGAQRIE